MTDTDPEQLRRDLVEAGFADVAAFVGVPLEDQDIEENEASGEVIEVGFGWADVPVDPLEDGKGGHHHEKRQDEPPESDREPELQRRGEPLRQCVQDRDDVLHERLDDAKVRL